MTNLGSIGASSATNKDDGKSERTGQGPRGRLSAPVVMQGRKAIESVERAICGTALVHDETAAAGLALTGKPTASLFDDAPGAARGLKARSTTPGPVFHRRLPTAIGGCHAMLVARDGQRAVDHCLVGHLVAARAGASMALASHAAVIDGLHLIELPPVELLDRLLDQSAAKATDEADLDAEIARAFVDVGTATGRELHAVDDSMAADAPAVIVASGAHIALARTVAKLARTAGKDIGVVDVAQIVPAPITRLSRALTGKAEVVVLGDGEGDPLAFGVMQAMATIPQDRQPSFSIFACTDPAVTDRGNGAGHEDDAAAVGGEGLLSTSTILALAARLGDETFVAAVTDAIAATASDPARPIAIGVAPYEEGTANLLARALAELGTTFGLSLAERADRSAARHIVVGSLGPQLESEAVDLRALVVADAALLERPEVVRLLGDGGTIVVLGGVDPRGLSAATRAALADRHMQIRSIDDEDAVGPGPCPTVDHAVGALLAALGPALEPLLNRDRAFDGNVIDSLVKANPARGAALRASAEAVRQVDLGAAAAPPGAAGTPVMPDATSVSAQPNDVTERWRDALRRFHLDGHGALSAADPHGTHSLQVLGAAAVHSKAGLATPSGDQAGTSDQQAYPFLIERKATASPDSLASHLSRTFAALAEGGQPLAMVAPHQGRIASLAASLIRDARGAVPAATVLGQTLEAFAAAFELSEAARTQLDGELSTLAAALGTDGQLVGLGRDTLPTLYASAVSQARRVHREELRTEAQWLCRRLRDLLRIDALNSGEAANRETFGGKGGALFDANALATTLPTRRGSTPLDEARKARIAAVTATLEGFVEGDAVAPWILLSRNHVTPASSTIVGPAPLRVEVDDPIVALAGIFDAHATTMVDVLRALRIARLEVQGEYDASRHDAAMAALDWQGLSAAELAQLPAVVAIERSDRMGRRQTELSALIRSGRPVHILITDVLGSGADSAPDLGGDGPEGGAFDAGLSYRMVAHREAFVLAGSLGDPGHLWTGMMRMATALRPAVAIVSTPRFGDVWPEAVQLQAAQLGRATPRFYYDPDAGSTFADRFDLVRNDAPAAAWPLLSSPYRTPSGEEVINEAPFTYAHAASFDSALRKHFRVIPSEAWATDQVEISTYLEQGAADRQSHLPFVEVIGAGGQGQRAILSRELAFACLDRMRLWRILQELGGLDNEYVRRALRDASRTAERERDALVASLRAEHDAELDRVRTETAGEAMDRLVAALMRIDTVPMAGGSARAASPVVPSTAIPSTAKATPQTALSPAADAATASPQAAPEAPSAAAPSTASEDAGGFDDPYIDTPLCTSCNECTNLNGRLFKYDGNKQATIADVTAGTFKDLVVAAEKCPAECIHPGAPRSGDSTANDDLVARAARFN